MDIIVVVDIKVIKLTYVHDALHFPIDVKFAFFTQQLKCNRTYIPAGSSKTQIQVICVIHNYSKLLWVTGKLRRLNSLSTNIYTSDQNKFTQRKCNVVMGSNFTHLSLKPNCVLDNRVHKI